MIKSEEEIKIYCSGPMEDCTIGEMWNWREDLKNKWKGKIIDPCRRNFQSIDDSRTKGIVTLDKVDIEISDVVLVNCWKYSAGTSMEILYAFEHGKLVVVYIEDEQRRLKISPWIIYHCHYLVSSVDEALDKIREHYSLDWRIIYV